MRLFKKGQGATEYLLMLAAVLVIVAIAVYYITSTPTSKIIGDAILADNTINFTPRTGTSPTAIAAADWEYSIWHDATQVKSWTLGTTVGSLSIGDTVSLPAENAATGDLLRFKYKGSVTSPDITIA